MVDPAKRSTGYLIQLAACAVFLLGVPGKITNPEGLKFLDADVMAGRSPAAVEDEPPYTGSPIAYQRDSS
jgi:hypothetical protein